MWQYKNIEVNSVYELITSYSKSEFDSPFRSTIPLVMTVQYFPQLFLKLTNNKELSEYKIIFEYETPVQKGKGLPSYSDLMLLNSQESICIEAKRTEPRYEKVEKWLNGTKNRELVLEGWIELINKKSINKIEIKDVISFPYQMVHRTASACSTSKETTKLVYFGYDLSNEMVDYYCEYLRNIKVLVGSSIEVIIAFFITKSNSVFSKIEKEWNNGKKQGLSNQIIDIISNSNFMNIELDKINYF